MKRINYIIVILISIFVLNNGVSAKSVSKVCEYNNSDSAGSTKFAATFKVYDDGSAEAIVTKVNNQTVNNSENIQNWSSIKSKYQSNKECPLYLAIYDNGTFSNTKVWAYYDQSEAISDATKNKANLITNAYEGVNASDSDKAQIKKKMSQYANSCNSYASKTYDMTNCQDQGQVTTKYTDCVNEADRDHAVIQQYVDDINGYVTKKYISANDEDYKTFKKMCDAAEKNIDLYKEALTYIKNKDYNEQSGTNIESKVSDNDVKDNKYVKDYNNKNNNYSERTYDTDGSDIFEICDVNKNPQLVASMKLIGIFVTIVKIIVPVILIILGSLDMSKAVVSKDNDAIQKALIVFFKRAVAAVLVFLAPTVILGIFDMVDNIRDKQSVYETCRNCILGSSKCPDVSFIQGN